jgi:hypothetical protein
MRDFGAEMLPSHRHREANTAVPITNFAEADYALAYTASCSANIQRRKSLCTGSPSSPLPPSFR